MPDIGFYHPLIVHFAIALVMIGVLFRWISFSGRAPFSGPAAAVLIFLGTAAAVAAAWSGNDAHVAVEDLPGIAPAVRQHQMWGERTRNILLAVALCEGLALLLVRRGRARPALLASGVLGLVSVFCLVQTGQRGGELVYAHAGGVGIRSGDPADVGRLFLAGLYHQAQLDEKAGRSADAALLLEIAARHFPADAAVQVLAAESLLVDRHDPVAALAALRKVTVPTAERRWRFRHGWLTADALDALGQADAAQATLRNLLAEFPDSQRVRRRLEHMGGNAK